MALRLREADCIRRSVVRRARAAESTAKEHQDIRWGSVLSAKRRAPAHFPPGRGSLVCDPRGVEPWMARAKFRGSPGLGCRPLLARGEERELRHLPVRGSHIA